MFSERATGGLTASVGSSVTPTLAATICRSVSRLVARKPDFSLAPYRLGWWPAAVLASRTGVPVVMAVVSGTPTVVPRGTWKPRLRGRCAVRFVPLGSFGGQDVETVRSLLQQRMSASVLALAA